MPWRDNLSDYPAFFDLRVSSFELNTNSLLKVLRS
jgi:hypothetical protein